jgi:hypothetical protein
MQVFAEGVDYSATASADWDGLAAALKAAGKSFAGRYAVFDKSPNGRGITAEEYTALRRHNIDCFLYYEETEAWMLGGWTAGVRAATRALEAIRQAGMPEGMPVYYSHDVDPEPAHFAAIDDCLRGAASVVGSERVGCYGGWLLIDHCAAGGTARYLCQTIAWQYGRGVHPAAHLHQYAFNQFYRGTECDLVAALNPHYGQASDFLPKPAPATTTTRPPFPAKRVPAPDAVLAQGHPLTHNDPDRFRCVHGTTFRTAPDRRAPAGRKTPAKRGQVYTFPWSALVDGERWLISNAGSWALANAFEPA